MRARVLILLLLLFLGGVPAVVFFTISRTAPRDGAWSGSQPGGIVSGVVRDTSGNTVGHAVVEVRAGRWAPKAGRPGALIASTDQLAFDETHTVRVETGADGLFEVAVDPVEGVYVFTALAEGFELRERFYSFLDAERKPLAVPSPVVFELPRSVRLVVEIETQSSGLLRGGYSLEHEATRWLGLAATGRIWSGRFEGAGFTLDRLVPGAAHLAIATDDGRRFECDVELSVGTLTVRVKL
ncbi:MAG: carboxypeptidase-like regulatory domain-containing protein [Planctomycetes bacterium]|nr:carboxypeptidase-like regulatory domain-containing protein [Planctomycetota bacterium]